MSQRRTNVIVNFETYAKKSRPTARFSRHSRTLLIPHQERLPLLSPLLEKCGRLEKRNQKLAAIIEGLVDDMLYVLEGRRP